VHLDEAPDDGQADSEAAFAPFERALALGEQLEDQWQ
jgi:hypothetical protein